MKTRGKWMDKGRKKGIFGNPQEEEYAIYLLNRANDEVNEKLAGLRNWVHNREMNTAKADRVVEATDGACEKPTEERVWLLATQDKTPGRWHDNVPLYDNRACFTDDQVDRGVIFECRMLENGHIEPVAVREAEKLRAEVEELREVNRVDTVHLNALRKERDKTLAEVRLLKEAFRGPIQYQEALETLTNERDEALAEVERLKEEQTKNNGIQFRQQVRYNELQAKHDKLLASVKEVAASVSNLEDIS